MEIIEKQIGELMPYKNNPRQNEEAVEYVANSIEEFGFQVPIIIDKNDVIIAGHTRLKAAERLGLKKVPCIVADDLNEAEANALRLADNKVQEISLWDFDKLQQELNTILTVDMSKYGFDGKLSDLDNFIDDELSCYYDGVELEYNVFGVTLSLPMSCYDDFREYVRAYSTRKIGEQLLEFILENHENNTEEN